MRLHFSFCPIITQSYPKVNVIGSAYKLNSYDSMRKKVLSRIYLPLNFTFWRIFEQKTFSTILSKWCTIFLLDLKQIYYAPTSACFIFFYFYVSFIPFFVFGFGHFWRQSYAKTKILHNLCLQFPWQDGQDWKNPQRKSRNSSDQNTKTQKYEINETLVSLFFML